MYSRHAAACLTQVLCTHVFLVDGLLGLPAGLASAGAIDVEELQYALEVMGIQKAAAEVQELMDSVDKDGSGEACCSVQCRVHLRHKGRRWWQFVSGQYMPAANQEALRDKRQLLLY